MSKHNVVELAGREKIRDELTDLIREGACKLIAQGLELEVSELLSALSGRKPGAVRRSRPAKSIDRYTRMLATWLDHSQRPRPTHNQLKIVRKWKCCLHT